MSASYLQEKIVNYWSVQPPFKGEGDVGTPEWSRSISEHRYRVIPYLKDWARFDAYAGKNVLEIGFGAGTDFLEFRRHGANIQGVDVTHTAVSLLQKRHLAEYGTLARGTIFDGRRLPFDDKSMDLVYSFGVLHHTPWIDDLISEAHRVLRPGGMLRGMVYNRMSLLYYYSIIWLRQILEHHSDISREEALSRYSEFRQGCPYTRVYSNGDMKERLWAFGNGVSIRGDYVVIDYPDNRKVTLIPEEFPHTGVHDVDQFFWMVGQCRKNHQTLLPFGWHVLFEATA